jgi:hypothetical protein
MRSVGIAAGLGPRRNGTWLSRKRGLILNKSRTRVNSLQTLFIAMYEEEANASRLTLSLKLVNG